MLEIIPIPYIIYVIGYNVWFYAIHRTFHARLLYKYHKKHNKKQYPTFYADNLENLLIGLSILIVNAFCLVSTDVVFYFVGT